MLFGPSTRGSPSRISDILPVFALVLLCGVCAGRAEELPISGFASLARPFLYRSDFMNAANAQQLRLYAAQGAAESGIAYTRAGFPSFTVKYQIDFQVPFRVPDWSKYCNQRLFDAIQNNVTLQKDLGLTSRDIELLRNGRNPSGYIWHHDARNGRMQLVPYDEHTKTPHVGGNTRWGAKSPSFAEMYGITALRWASIAGLDFAFSMSVSWFSGTLTRDVVMKEVTGVAASWASASTVEYLLTVFSSSGMGGPAAWSGAAAYLVVRLAVGRCWAAHEARQFQIQEQICRQAEGKARWQNYLLAVQSNNNILSGD
jgi:hypothetical protein